MRWVVLAVLAACGRVGFDTAGGTGVNDATSDGIDSLINADGPPPALLVYLPFDDNPLDGADNLGIASGTGQCTPNCPTPVPGKHGNAFHFNGTNQGIRLPHDTRLELQSGTFAAWVLLDATPVLNEHNVIGGTAYNDTGSNSFEMFVWEATGGGVFLAGGGDVNNGGPYTGLSWTSTGVWTHVAMTWTAGASQRLVVNGVTQDSEETFTTNYDMHDLMIGCDEDPGGFVHFWEGAIDDVVVTDRELSDAEIAQLVALGS